MAISEIQTSLNAGELSPNLYARVDLSKFESGAALLRNFYVDFRGGVANRPGTEYICAVKGVDGPKRLIPFTVSTQASYVLEFGEAYIRFISNGVQLEASPGVPYEVTTPYAAADLALLKYTQSADVLTLVHPSYPPANLTRTSDTTFSYDVIVTGPVIDPPVITDMTAPHSGPYNFGYLVTSVDLDGKEESLPSNPGVKHSEGMNELTNRVIGMSWTAPSQATSAYNVYKWGPIDAVTLNPATVWGFIGTSQTVTFTDNNIAPDFTKQPPAWGDPFSGGQFQSITVTSGGSGYDGVSGDWPVIPYVPLNITGDGTGAAGYAVIDHSNGTIIGAYLTNFGKDYTTATITANGEGGTGATFSYTLSPITSLYPSCTAYVQQRRCFAGSNLKPETLVMSQIGLYENFDTTPVSLDTDSIVLSIAGEEVNTIKAMVPVAYGLLTFTTGGSYLINGGSPYAPITPASISVQAQSSVGANDLMPLRVNTDVLYCQNKGNRIRNLAFAWQRQAYQGSDISALAAHLFDGYSTTEWTWAEEPFKLVWAVRDDGRMLTLTYVPDQEVFAWCRHDTQGLFKSVTSVPEGDENAVYVIVERYIPDAAPEGECCTGWVQYIERLAPRGDCCIYDAWFLDCALSLPKTYPDGQLCLTHVSGNTYTAHFCANGDVGYVMEAKENYPAARIADLPTWHSRFVETSELGISYDHRRRKMLYTGLFAENDPTTNDTGFTLWSGVNTISPGDTYETGSHHFNKDVSIIEVDFDTGVVVEYPVWSADNLVPAGIGGGDGTWRRFVTDFTTSGASLPLVINPHNHDVWVSAESCELYQFRYEDSFQQVISPFFPVIDTDNFVKTVGITEDYVYAYELNFVDLSGDPFYMIPATITSDEVTADQKLAYATYSGFPDHNSQFWASAVDGDKNLWILSASLTGTRDYKLLKFTPPVSISYPTPPVGGGFTDVTPWGSSTGPNTDVSSYASSTYYSGTSFQGSANVVMYLPASGQLAMVTKLFKQDAGSSDQANTRFDCTYVTIAGMSFDYHKGFVGGYMTAEWAVTSDPSAAAWAPQDFKEHNQYLSFSDYTYAGMNYARRAFLFSCLPVVGGVVSSDLADLHSIIVIYDFINGSAPTLVQMVDEQGWDDTYTDYATAISNTNVVEQSMQPKTASPGVPDQPYLDTGLWDADTNTFWWSGLQRNMYKLDSTFTYRDSYFPEVLPPLLRMSFNVPETLSGVISTGCAQLSVVEQVDDTTYTVELLGGTLDELLLPDDPSGVLRPVEANDWYTTTPVTTVTGLDHLEGKVVYALADGRVEGPFTVSSGSITLSAESANVVVGLQYTSQIKTLYLTVEGLQPGTIQGKRKFVPAVTLRVDCTAGLEAGIDFDNLTPVPDLDTTEPYTGDARVVVFSDWTETGEVCVQQTQPLPAGVLGIIVEVTPGDTGR